MVLVNFIQSLLKNWLVEIYCGNSLARLVLLLPRFLFVLFLCSALLMFLYLLQRPLIYDPCDSSRKEITYGLDMKYRYWCPDEWIYSTQSKADIFTLRNRGLFSINILISETIISFFKNIISQVTRQSH